VVCILKRVWQNDSVEFWYAQNTLLFVKASLLESNTALKAEFEQTNLNQLCLVHPKQYRALEAVARAQPPPPPSGVRAASRLLLVCLRDLLVCLRDLLVCLRNSFRKRLEV
jgi:hypothetical protein